MGGGNRSQRVIADIAGVMAWGGWPTLPPQPSKGLGGWASRHPRTSGSTNIALRHRGWFYRQNIDESASEHERLGSSTSQVVSHRGGHTTQHSTMQHRASTWNWNLKLVSRYKPPWRQEEWFRVPKTISHTLFARTAKIKNNQLVFFIDKTNHTCFFAKKTNSVLKHPWKFPS